MQHLHLSVHIAMAITWIPRAHLLDTVRDLGPCALCNVCVGKGGGSDRNNELFSHCLRFFALRPLLAIAAWTAGRCR